MACERKAGAFLPRKRSACRVHVSSPDFISSIVPLISCHPINRAATDRTERHLGSSLKVSVAAEGHPHSREIQGRMVLAVQSRNFLSSKKLFGIASLSLMAAMSVTTTSTMMAAGMAVPERLLPTPVMKNYKWKSTSLLPLDLTIGVQEGTAKKGSEIISKHSGSAGSIAFVVRRPG